LITPTLLIPMLTTDRDEAAERTDEQDTNQKPINSDEN